MSAFSVHSTCSQCLRALRKQASSSGQATRAFSASTARTKSINLPNFSESSSDEFVNFVAPIRDTIFLPGQLKFEQQKLIYRTKNHAMLLNEPFLIDVGDDKHRLMPLDRTHDVQSSWKSVMKAVEVMEKNPQDWVNLPAFLGGMKDAGRKFKPQKLAALMRKVGLEDQARIVVRCIKEVERTGVSMKNVEIAQEVAYAIRNHAFLNDWSEASVIAAHKLSQQMTEAVYHRGHIGTSHLDPVSDCRSMPEVLGVAAELAVVRCQKINAGNDTDGQVQRAVNRLVANLKEFERIKTSSETIKSLPQSRWGRHADQELLRWVPSLRALQHGQTVLEHSDSELSAIKDQIDAHLREISKIADDANQSLSEDKLALRIGSRWLKGTS